MEMLTAMGMEVQSDLDRLRSGSDFGFVNLLSGSFLALDQVRGLYQQLGALNSPQVSTYEGTSLMIPCNGVKRVSVPKGWAGG